MIQVILQLYIPRMDTSDITIVYSPILSRIELGGDALTTVVLIYDSGTQAVVNFRSATANAGNIRSPLLD